MAAKSFSSTYLSRHWWGLEPESIMVLLPHIVKWNVNLFTLKRKQKCYSSHCRLNTITLSIIIDGNRTASNKIFIFHFAADGESKKNKK